MGAFLSSFRESGSDLWVSSDVLSGCQDVARQLGLDAEHYLRRNGIEPYLMSSSRGLLPFHAVCNFLEDVARSEGLPDFGFRLGLAQPPLQYGIISQLPVISPTVGEAFKNFFHFQKLYSQSSHWELIVEDDYAFMRRHDVAMTARASPQMIMLSITLAFVSVRAVAGPDWQPIGVYLELDESPCQEAMRRHFGVPVFSGSAHNELAFDASDLLRPIATSNPSLLTVLTQYFDQLLHAVPGRDDLTSLVFHEIRSNLGDHRCTLEWIASSLRIHPRTLQRLLVSEGTSFRDLLREARIELADYLLRLTRTPISDISALLGYSNVSAFSRAFEKERGYPPSRERITARKSALPETRRPT